MREWLIQDGMMLFARLLGVLVAIPVHEVAHAFVSDRLGDHTARSMGRLTLNPIKHIDPWGLLCMLVIGVGWAKPVPVTPGRYHGNGTAPTRWYHKPKWGMALTAVAGPASNLLLALLVVLVQKVLLYGGHMALGPTPFWLVVVLQVLVNFAFLNVTLALFNLIPIPPLDGSRILGLLLPEKLYFGLMCYERYIMVALMAVVFLLPRLTGFSPLGWLLGGAGNAVLAALGWMTGFVDILFFWLMG